MIASVTKNAIFTAISAIFLTISLSSQAAFIPAKVRTGQYFSCAISTEGSVKCWGDNSLSNLGTGNDYNYGYYPYSMGNNLPAVNLGTDVKVNDLCAGAYHACALTTNGKIKCWGWQHTGALGQGSFVGPTVEMGDSLKYVDLGSKFYAKSLACSQYHACALNDEGKAKCWGLNDRGQLGVGDTINRGDKPDQMGDKLPFLTTSKPIQAITVGGFHTCALFDEGVKCWGNAEYSELGQQNRMNLGAMPETKDLDKIPPILIEGPGKRIKIRKLTSGAHHNCVLYKNDANDSDHVKCWGFNTYGALGVGNSDDYGGTPDSMAENLPVVDVGVNKIVDLQGGLSSSCVLYDQGRMKCWGSNFAGRLGLGDQFDRGVLPNQMGNFLPQVDLGLPIKAIDAGNISNHTCAILANNYIKCWGLGSAGQLGYEDGFDRGGLPNQMGEFLPFVRLD